MLGDKSGAYKWYVSILASDALVQKEFIRTILLLGELEPMILLQLEVLAEVDATDHLVVG